MVDKTPPEGKAISHYLRKRRINILREREKGKKKKIESIC